MVSLPPMASSWLGVVLLAVLVRVCGVLTVPVTLRAPAGRVKGRADLRFVVDSDAEGVQAVEETRFFGPIP